MGNIGAETGALALDLYSGHQAKVLSQTTSPLPQEGASEEERWAERQ